MSASWLAAFLAAWNRGLGSDWFHSADIWDAIEVDRSHTHDESVWDWGKSHIRGDLSRAAGNLPGWTGLTKLKFARLLQRLEYTDVGGYRLRREYDSGKKTWRFAVDRTADKRHPATKRKSLEPKRRVIPTGAKAPPVVKVGKEILSTQDVPHDHEEVAALVKAAERQRQRSPGPREEGDLAAPTCAYAEQEAARAALLASDPFPGECVSGSWPTLGEAETAAGWLKCHGIGAASCTFELDSKHFARTVGAPEPERTAQAMRLIRRDWSVRVGLHGERDSSAAARQRNVALVAEERTTRQMAAKVRKE